MTELPVSFRQFLWLWNRQQGLPTPLLHRRIASWLERRWRAGDRRLVLTVFRNAGKSTLVGLFSAWLLSRDPNLRILVLAAEHQLATKMSRNIKRIIERHPLTSKLLPDSRELWSADQITVRRPQVLRDPSVIARGITANLTGMRADLVIGDDVEVPNTAGTPAKREALRERLREIAYILNPQGTQLYIGTPHSHHSIYATEPNRELREERPFLHGFRRLHIPILDAQGNSAWPERFDLAAIEAVRQSTGPVKFKSQMLLEPATEHDLRLDPALLVRYAEPLELVRGNGEVQLRIGQRRMVAAMCWWDPAFGQPDRGDSSVVACVLADADGHFWLHGIRYLTVSPERLAEEDAARQLCRQVVEFCEQHHQTTVAIERNGIGAFLPGTMQGVLREMGVELAIRPVHTRSNKQERILAAFDPVLSARRLHAHESVWRTPFIQEMREWLPDRQSRDDGLDAVAGCLTAQPVRIRPLALTRPARVFATPGLRATTGFDV